ncbi:MFS transporter [Methanocella arvoryzae]|uniref:Permease (Major facilitator superfamily) n=1 Tax=Methanocella arvoryzae (strain DSM 22066 / NBRC 105507 / MRE50) TaxID=351160 RepID=Q0W1D9_METAR|nr:MFS transporter [Methanocella arvoryzae]CAJ37804.1 permease (major facilitator superfamily) [Methanocella arvoryzae MRE50]
METKKEGLLNMDKNQKLALLVVFIAIFTDMLIYCMIVPILPEYASGLGASQQMIGLLFASYAITFLLAAPVVGVLSDRVGRKLPMLVGLLGLFGSTLLFAFSSDLTMLFVARALQGVSAGATWTAGLALLSDLFPPKMRQQAIGIGISGSFAGTLLGPLFGGALYEYGGYALPFLAAAGLVLIDGIARLLLLKDPPRLPAEQQVSLKSMLKNRTILLMAGVIVLVSAATALLEPVLPLYLSDVLKVSPTMIGLLFAVTVVASLIASPLSYKVAERFGRKRVIIAGLICSALILPTLALSGSFILEVVLMAALGGVLAIGLASVPLEMTDVIDRLGQGGYGAVYAIYNLALSFGMMAGPIAGGLLAGSFGITAGLGIGGAFMIGYAMLLLIVMRGSGKASEEGTVVSVSTQ